MHPARFSAVAALILCGLLPIGLAVAQAPITPPGPPLVIVPVVPPAPAPTPAPDSVDPSPDDLKPPFAIKATIGGEIIGDEHVSLPVGRLLVLEVQGVPGEGRPSIAWALNAPSTDVSVREGGWYVTFAAPVQGNWLFTAAVNNHDVAGPPLVAQRWVKVGHGPQPPPGPEPGPTPVDPPKPEPDTTVGFKVLILRDQDRDGSIPLAQYTAIQSRDVRGYLTTNCDKEPDGAPAWRSWDDSYTDEQITDGDWLPRYRKALADSNGTLPWVTIWGDTGVKTSEKLPANEADLLALLKRYKGSR
jgi:hypothetical protein